MIYVLYNYANYMTIKCMRVCIEIENAVLFPQIDIRMSASE